MPLYEFYCEPCHTLYTFRSPRVDTVTLPVCPDCGQELKREISPFSHSVRGKTRADTEENPGDLDRMDVAAAKLSERLHALERDDADPREAVRVMRELAREGGVRFNREVQEAMARIESGEDPEQVEETFREVFDTENPFESDNESPGPATTGWWRRIHPPRRDPVWRDLPERG